MKSWFGSLGWLDVSSVDDLSKGTRKPFGTSGSSCFTVGVLSGSNGLGNTCDTFILFSANQDISTKRRYFDYLVGSFRKDMSVERCPIP